MQQIRETYPAKSGWKWTLSCFHRSIAMSLEFHSSEFHSTNLSKIEASTLDYLIHRIKHDLAILPIVGVKTDSLSDWCQCRNRTREREIIPIVIWKYYHQAQHYFKIGAFDRKMIPKFLVSMQDLNPSLLRELANLDNEDRNYVLKQAVGHLFEDINSGLYHASISKILEVKLVE